MVALIDPFKRNPILITEAIGVGRREPAGLRRLGRLRLRDFDLALSLGVSGLGFRGLGV